MLTSGPEIFSKNTFALNPATCPSGPPRQTTEESAAHHLLVKTLQNIIEKSILQYFRFSAAVHKKSHVEAKSAKICHVNFVILINE